MRVAVLGGTGAFGSALARRLVEAGMEVTIGSRAPERAAATADELATTTELADAIGRTPVLSVASELRVAQGAAFPSDELLSLAERMQQTLHGPVVAGLHSLAAGELAAGKAKGDALVCGDDETAKAAALELASTLVTGRALDAGPLASARALEAMTAVIVNLNRRYRGHAGLQIVGL